MIELPVFKVFSPLINSGVRPLLCHRQVILGRTPSFLIRSSDEFRRFPTHRLGLKTLSHSKSSPTRPVEKKLKIAQIKIPLVQKRFENKRLSGFACGVCPSRRMTEISIRPVTFPIGPYAKTYQLWKQIYNQQISQPNPNHSPFLTLNDSKFL